MNTLFPNDDQPRRQSTDYTAVNYRESQKGDRIGFFDVVGPGGLTINGATLHKRGDTHWIGWPGREYLLPDGSPGFANLIDFPSKEARREVAADLTMQAWRLRTGR
jgi:hypothetical protein